MLPNSIRDLEPDERRLIDEYLNDIRGIVAQVGDEDGDSEMTIQGLQLTYELLIDELLVSESEDDPDADPSQEMEGLIMLTGIGYGALLSDTLGLDWRMGQYDGDDPELMVCDPHRDIMLFPVESVANHFEQEKREFFVGLFDETVRKVKDMQSSGDYESDA
ncbi:MAG: hypothetical protein AAFP90_08065 [Planctomycetota bacterium]